MVSSLLSWYCKPMAWHIYIDINQHQYVCQMRHREPKQKCDIPISFTLYRRAPSQSRIRLSYPINAVFYVESVKSFPVRLGHAAAGGNTVDYMSLSIYLSIICITIYHSLQGSRSSRIYGCCIRWVHCSTWKVWKVPSNRWVIRLLVGALYKFPRNICYVDSVKVSP